MKGLELIQAKRKSFPVCKLKEMFGIGKTESYWILKNRDIQTITINGNMRILSDSFWNWYNGQTKYRIIGGPEPGSKLKETSYSVQDLMTLLNVSDYVIYSLIAKGVFDIFKVDYKTRITKESFARWYPTQEKYRLPDDRDTDRSIIEKTYSMPEIGKILGLHRNTVYSILNNPIFEIIYVAGQKRVTIESFENWYSSQNKYKQKEQEDCDYPNEAETETKEVFVELTVKENKSQINMQPAKKDSYRLDDLMASLSISRKAAYKLIQSGDIIAVKAGKSYIIPASEYKRYMERRTENGFDHSEK